MTCFDVSIISIITIVITILSRLFLDHSAAEVRKLCEEALLTIEQAAGRRPAAALSADLN